jgi:hypothetical protein
MGDSKWHPAMEFAEIKDIFEKDHVFEAGDTGPEGGMVFFHDVRTERNVMEAAPELLGPVPASDAKMLCANYSGGKMDDWRLPTEEELRAFTVAQFLSHNKDISHTNHSAIVLWSLGKAGKYSAICSQEYHDKWPAGLQQPAVAKTIQMGNVVPTPEKTPLYVRPVRLIQTIPVP